MTKIKQLETQLKIANDTLAVVNRQRDHWKHTADTRLVDLQCKDDEIMRLRSEYETKNKIDTAVLVAKYNLLSEFFKYLINQIAGEKK